MFTGDACDITFEDLHIKADISNSYRFKMIQVPHHGSELNIFREFWQNLYFLEGSYAAISAGINSKHDHPNYSTVEFFHKLGFHTECTNYVNGYKLYYDGIDKETLNRSIILDNDSEIVFDTLLEKDLVYSVI